MAHIRQRIREDVITRLESASPPAPVLDSFVGDVGEDADPPLINVSTPSGQAEIEHTGGTTRADSLLVAYYFVLGELELVHAGERAQAAIDAYCVWLEQTLGQKFEPQNARLIMQEWESDIDTESDQVRVVVQHDYALTYDLTDNNPEV